MGYGLIEGGCTGRAGYKDVVAQARVGHAGSYMAHGDTLALLE